MEEELAFLLSFLEEPQKFSIGKFNFTSGKLNGVDVVMQRCGIGKVQAAAGCATLINRFNPSLVLNTGVAGGVDESLDIADVVIADNVVYHDVDVTAFNYAPGQIPGQPKQFSVLEEHIKIVEKAVDELKSEKLLPQSMNHFRGLIGSGDSFICDVKRIAELKKPFPALMAVEMESAAIAHCSRLFNIPFIIIRAISDVADTESPVTFEQFTPIAAKHSAEIVRRVIKNINI